MKATCRVNFWSVLIEIYRECTKRVWVKIITIRKEKLNLLNDIKVKKLRKRESVIDTSVKQHIMMGHSLLCKVNELKKTKIKE